MLGRRIEGTNDSKTITGEGATGLLLADGRVLLRDRKQGDREYAGRLRRHTYSVGRAEPAHLFENLDPSISLIREPQTSSVPKDAGLYVRPNGMTGLRGLSVYTVGRPREFMRVRAMLSGKITDQEIHDALALPPIKMP